MDIEMDMEFDENLEPGTEQPEDGESGEPGMEGSAEEPAVESGESGEDGEKELADRLGALIDILTPEEPEASEGAEGGADAVPGDSQGPADACLQELLESINGALSAMEAENAAFHADAVCYQEEARARQEHASSCLECGILVLLATAFFVALSAGRGFADSFFNRMRG